MKNVGVIVQKQSIEVSSGRAQKDLENCKAMQMEGNHS